LVLLLGVVVEVEVFDEALEETLEILRWRWRDWVLGVRVFAWGRRRSWENSSLVEEMRKKGKFANGNAYIGWDFL